MRDATPEHNAAIPSGLDADVILSFGSGRKKVRYVAGTVVLQVR